MDLLSVWDIMRLTIMGSVPTLPAGLCALQPCCRRLSTIASVFSLSSRVAKVAVAWVIGAPWSRSSCTTDRYPSTTA